MTARILIVLFALCLGGQAWAVSSPAELLADPAQERRAEMIGNQLRCLVCQNQSVEDSDADLARDLRRIVRQRVVAGDNDKQIMEWMTARYGDFVRLRPPFRPVTWILWLSPVVFLGIGGTAVLLARARNVSPPTPLDAAERARLDRLLQEP
jgi:cytochrome c-type biogenesis protein CcmH